MPKFSQRSLANLATCHVDIQTLFNEVIKNFDCVITEGYRNQEDQEKAFNAGNSKLHYPHGKHNQKPSRAVDAYPFEEKVTVNWKDINRIYYFSGYVMGVAQKLKDEGKMTHSIRYGGDWDGDTQVRDETFKDIGHYEIV